MNILCIGYYDKFSRFFLGIKSALKKENPNLQFKIYSLYFSGFFYSFLRGNSSSLFSFKAWWNVFFNKRKYLKIVGSQTHYHSIDLHELIAYQFQLNEKTSRKQMLLQAISYIDLMHKEIERFQPDAILLIGDSRLLIEITKQLAQQRKIKTWFVEQGPFQTTFFDEKGVNANASIRGFSSEENSLQREKIDSINSFLIRNRQQKYSRCPFYRGIDYFLDFLLKKSSFYPPDLKVPEPFLKKYDLCKNKNFTPFDSEKFHEENPNKPIFLLICQVPFDVNMSHHSPHFNSHFELLKNVYQNLPENAILVVREHPLFKGKYERIFYDFLQENSIYIDCNKDFNSIFDQANIILVNNSTVGLEAISRKKTVVVLGNSYYDHSGICLKLVDKCRLRELLEHSLEFRPDPEKINAFLYEFLFNHLIEGFITDEKQIAPKSIAQRINCYFKNQSAS
ncbi:MAG TPA: hypothetical protein VFM82_06975 [Flavobacteriaceae bacterium]|nr:hypothetical protein [Flavobacteriaceae bacterium]